MCLIRHHTILLAEGLVRRMLLKKRCKGIAFLQNLQHFSKKIAKKSMISWYSRHFAVSLQRILC